MHGLRLHRDFADLDAFVFRDHLRTEQQQRGCHFQTEQHDNGRGERTLYQVHLGQRAEIPAQRMSNDFPQQSRCRATDQRVLHRQSACGHEVVDRGDAKDFHDGSGDVD